MSHIPVLLKEVVGGMNLERGDIVLDGTIGGAGYLVEISKIIGDDGILIGIDQDGEALKRAEGRLAEYGGKKYFVSENFRNLDKVLKDLNIEKIQGAVFDLGISSFQLDTSERGFTFQKNEPLLMSFKKDLKEEDLTAKEIVNTWDEENIADIIFGYGEEKFARKIAKKIVERRVEKPIETTFDLVEIIREAVPLWYTKGRTHFATKTFQALRIAVNDEIESLREGVEKALGFLDSGGRIAVVSFHSLEDRVVKNFFRDKEKENEGKRINKKIIEPTEIERKNNPRSRSAKLRIFEKI